MYVLEHGSIPYPFPDWGLGLLDADGWGLGSWRVCCCCCCCCPAAETAAATAATAEAADDPAAPPPPPPDESAPPLLNWALLTGTLTGIEKPWWRTCWRKGNKKVEIYFHDGKKVLRLLTRFPLIWFLCIIIWNSSSILLYLASVLGVSVVSSSPSESPPSGEPGPPPLLSFLFKA